MSHSEASKANTEYSKIPEVLRLEDDPAYLETFRDLMCLYVQKNFIPSVKVKGLVPAQEQIPVDFQKQRTLPEMLALAERVLGEPVPKGIIQATKDAAAKQTQKHYDNLDKS